jgi:hypothetical protein
LPRLSASIAHDEEKSKPTYRSVLMTKLLKALKTLSMDSRTLALIAQTQAIPLLVSLLQESSLSSEHVSQVLPCLFNLCRLDPVRQLAAAQAGLIPHLQQFIRTNNPLKQFCLPIICQMVHTKTAREYLWKENTPVFLLQLMIQEIRTTWPSTALESLAAWMADETAEIEAVLVENIGMLVTAFTLAQAVSYVAMLEPLYKLTTLSPRLSRDLANSSVFINSLLEKGKLHHPDALVRLNVVRLLATLVNTIATPSSLSGLYPTLLPSISDLARHDASVLVQELASNLSVRLGSLEKAS